MFTLQLKINRKYDWVLYLIPTPRENSTYLRLLYTSFSLEQIIIFRIFDNPALNLAAEQNKPVIPVFVWSEGEEGPRAAGKLSCLYMFSQRRRSTKCSVR